MASRPAVIVSDNLSVQRQRERYSRQAFAQIRWRRSPPCAITHSSRTSAREHGVRARIHRIQRHGQGQDSDPADALLGRPISGQIHYLTGTRGFRRTELGFYAQDIYKATQKLTLTLGLRYENFIGWPWTEVADRMYQFVPEKQDVARVGTEGIPRSGARPRQQ